MRKFRPNALSLAVAIAISSSIIVTQALADRRLQIKSFDIRGNGHKEFTRSEVIVKPTSGDDQQPIPGSFTTTYPDQTEVRAGYEVPSEGFTDVLSGIEGGVSSVDLFATDDNEIAQKYTKVLKVGNEGIFKFTHHLAETKLVIEVRKGMTDQSSIAAVRAQSNDIQPLEPFTKVANPELLVGVLKGANERAGSLGEVDHYVALATIEVDKVEVNGRTFMRLIAAGDQPPELQRLGQSLFVNDEVLLAAATSAYARVHLLGEDVQQETLNKLLSYHKPVGYVVYVEDGTQAYPVPADFPKLEVTETPGEIIVFRGQKQNPTDIAFIEGIYNVWMEEFYNSPRPRETIQVKKDRVKSYQYIIRSRQMAQLEELAAEHNNGIVKSTHTSLLYHGKLVTLAYYEYLQQTLTCAASDGADEFKFTMPHVRFVSSFITPTWMHIQLVKRFSFKPVLGNLLTNRDFIQNIHEIIRSDITVFSNDYFDDPFSEEEGFASKVTGRFAGQLIEMENELQALRATEAKLNDQKELTERTLTERTIVSVIPSGQKKQKISGQIQYCEDELAQIHTRIEEQENQIKTLQQEVDQIPLLKKQVRDARADATKARNAELAADPGIDNRHATQTPEEQARLISRKVREIDQSVAATFAATGLPVEDSLEARLRAIERELRRPPCEQDMGTRLRLIQGYLRLHPDPTDKLFRQRMAFFEAQLGLEPNNKADMEARHLAIDQAVQQYLRQQAGQQHLQQQNPGTEAEKVADIIKPHSAAIALRLNIKDFDHKIRTLNPQSCMEAPEAKPAQIRTQSNPKPMPEVLETLSAVEKALKMHDLDENDDVYLRRRGISENMREYIRDARQLAENEALDILDDVEVVLDIRVNEEDDKTTRLTRVFITLNSNPLSEKILDAVLNRIDNIRWQYESKTQDEKEHKLIILLANLHDKVEGSDPDMQAREQQSAVLEAVEKILNIKFDEWDDNAARLARVHTLLADHDVSEQLLDQIDQTLWKEDSKALNKKDLKYNKIRATLIYKVEDAYLDKHAREQQTILLRAVEDELSINPDENVAARESGRAFTVKLAKDLNVALEQDDNLSDQKDILRARILELIEESNTAYDDEAARRSWNNAVAHQLNIEDYREDAIINDQNSLIEKKLLQLDDLVINTGQPDVNERIAAIENALDRQLTRLGPSPRYVLDRELANARRALENTENGLKEVYRELKTISGKHVLFAGKRSDLQHLPDEEDATLNRLMKQLQTGFGLAAGDEQTSEERLEDIRHFLREYSTEKRDEIIKILGARADLNIHIKEDDLSSLQKNDYFFSVTSHKKNHGPDETGTLEEALGELPLARKKYTQITEFLREHHKKFMDMINAMSEQRDAQENLDRKQQKIIDFGGIDEEAKTLHKHEMVELSLILKQKCEAVSKAEDALTDYNVAFLGATEKAVDLKPDTSYTFKRRLDILRNRQVQLGGHDGTGGEIRQLIQEQARLEDEIEPRKANIERIREVLKAAEEAVENDGAPSQFTPRQIKVLTDIHDFMQQHSLKKQALEAAMGLAELAEKRGGLIPYFPALGFADELQPLRLITSIGDGLTLDQASRIVEVFKSLKTTFPPPLNPGKDQPLNVPKKVHELVVRARRELQNGAQQYDDEIRGMGKTAIHFVECEPKELKSFSEYFAAHSASGHKIITLLREGLISKVELENYIKAVRSVDGYEPVEEFEHLLGYRRGIKLIHFRAVVHGLSEKSAEEFMQSAFAPVTVTTTGPAGMKASVAGMKEYAAVVIANYVLDDVAFENGRKTVAFLTNVQDTLTPYANAVGVSESELIKAIHDTLMQTHAAAVEQQLIEYWIKPSAFLVQAVTWYFSSYKPLLVTRTVPEAARLTLSNIAYLYLLDLTNRGDYTHRMLIPFQHWLERYGVDPGRTGQHAYHSGIEQISEVGGLAMPLGRVASSVILLRTGSMLFTRQYNANPQMYRSIVRLVPEILKSIASGQGVQVPLLHRITPEKVKILASATAGLVLGPVATVGAYAHGLISGFTYAQTFGFALASSLTFDFFMNDNKMLTQWLGGPLGRSLDRINRWRGAGETESDYVKRTAIATPQHFSETDEEYANRIKTNNMINGWTRIEMHGWTRNENYLQFRERRDRTMKLYEHGWEKYFRDNVPKWSFSHAENIPYSYTLGRFFESRIAAPEETPP